MNYLEIKHLKKHFQQTEVLKDISFSVEPGEVVSIIGPSGSGKSTLLRCCTFLETLSSGEIAYMGETAVSAEDGKKPVYAPTASFKKIQHYFGLVFQNFNLFPHYSVLRNITEAPRLILKKNKTEAEANAMRLLQKVGLADKAKAYPCELSGGQQQRVAIVRALAMEPSILFFDEPTSGLDYRHMKEVANVLRQVRDAGITVYVITHDLELILDCCTDIIHLEDGSIIDQYGMDEDGLRKIREYFIKGVSEK